MDKIRIFFERLLSIRDELFCIIAPEGEYDLLGYIRKRTEERYVQSVLRKLKILFQLGFLEAEYDEVGVMIRLKILQNEWNTERVSPFFVASGIGKKFAILVDYKNLEDNFKIPGSAVNPEVLKDFFLGLEDELLQHGEILFPFVFIPDNYYGIAPITQLSNSFQYFPIPCPRRKVDAVPYPKEADSVDAKMCDLGRKLIYGSLITDLVIISGDADFLPLVMEAKRYQKTVHVLSTPEALSGKFVDISGYVNVRPVTPNY